MWSIQESQPKFSERNTFIQMDTWIIIKGWQSESTFLPKGSACTKAEVGSVASLHTWKWQNKSDI